MISVQYLYNLSRYILRKFYIPYNRIKLRISGASDSAGSVVTKDIPSDCIAAGNPCRVIKSINNE